MKVVIDSQWIPLGTHWHYTSHSLWWCCEVRYFIVEAKAWCERGHWGMGGAQRSASASFTAVLSCFYGDARLFSQSINWGMLFIGKPWAFLCKHWHSEEHRQEPIKIVCFKMCMTFQGYVETESKWICNLRNMLGLNWVSFHICYMTKAATVICNATPL